ncbi:MAG: sodium:solute symporter family protein [Sphingomonadales bacterium]|nr:sodium:solute symporter family protein [Sphingomonadales bacterium]
MSDTASPVAIGIFVALFFLISSLGFVATRWKKADLNQLDEWGLGGRRFGPLLVWFLLGGDLYTAYTFVALPALMYASGGAGFFAVPYSIVVFPIVFAIFPKLWTICSERGYVTAADLVGGLFRNRALALMIALTGIVATMPYLSLQLVGLEAIFAGLGLHASVTLFGHEMELPLLVAFAVMAGFTYNSGIRAPAIIAVVKDILIYTTLIAAIVVIPAKLGGYGAIFDAVPAEKLIIPPTPPGSLGPQFAYATLALGGALGLFLYPHALTGLLAASSRDAIRRNAVFMPIYAFALALLLLLGFMALASGVKQMPEFADGFARFGNIYAVPALFNHMFPPWFVGTAFAAIAIGALVPGAIMSIAAANLFTRNIYRAFIRPDCSEAHETQVAKIFSLLVKAGALGFVTFFPETSVVQLQLIGGIWMCQTLPAVLMGLYFKWLSGNALLLGWAAGIGAGTAMAAATGFKDSVYTLTILGLDIPCYSAVSALVLNIAVAVLLSLALRPSARPDTMAPAPAN